MRKYIWFVWARHCQSTPAHCRSPALMVSSLPEHVQIWIEIRSSRLSCFRYIILHISAMMTKCKTKIPNQVERAGHDEGGCEHHGPPCLVSGQIPSRGVIHCGHLLLISTLYDFRVPHPGSLASERDCRDAKRGSALDEETHHGKEQVVETHHGRSR